MTNLSNCKRCGKLFVKMNKAICPECLEQEEEDFEKVKKYLDDNPTATINQVSRETEVSEKMIRKFIEEGRLLTTKYAGISVSCKRCGKDINEGRYCDACQAELQNQMEAAKKGEDPEEAPKKPKKDDKGGFEPPETKHSGKVHIRDRWNRRRR